MTFRPVDLVTQSAPKDKEEVVVPRQRPVSRPPSPAPSRPSSPLVDSASQFAEALMPDLGLENLAPRTDTSKEGTVAPEVEKHHEQPERVENLGASQTGAESEAVKASAESEQEVQPRQVPPTQ